MTAVGRVGIAFAVVVAFAAGVASADAAATPPVAAAQEAPTDTPAPSETSPPDSGEDETPWWVLLIVLGGLFVLFVALLVGRRRKPSPAPPPGWKAHAQQGYAEARWLSDNLTESLAIWHGDGESEGATAESRAEVWEQLSPRMERATSALYALEAAAAPNSPALRASQSTIAALNATFAAVTERSDARSAYRSVAGGDDAEALTAARDREARAATALSSARQDLKRALDALSPIA